MSKKLTIDEVRLKVNRYHQGLTVPDQPYVNNETKLRVVCNLHGEFYTAAAELRRGVGCPECGKLKSRKSRSVNNKSKILSGLVAAHPELSFSHFDEDYTTATGLIRVTCPIHGEFRKAPHKMITSRQGCPHCGKERSVQSRKYSLDKVISLFKKAHGDRYDYSEVLDAYFMDKVKIKYKLHGPF